jgi:hypothetical protein
MMKKYWKLNLHLCQEQLRNERVSQFSSCYPWDDVFCVSVNLRTVGSAKNLMRITSGFGGGEYTKPLRKVCTCQKLKFSFLLIEYCKIRECYTCIVYCCIWTVTLAKSIVPQTWRKLWISVCLRYLSRDRISICVC